MSIVKSYMKLDGIADLKQFFLEKGIQKEYAKNELFIHIGQSHNQIGYIIKGGFRYLGYSSEGERKILGYCFENDFVVDYAAFQIQKMAAIDAQSVRNSTVLALSYGDFNSFFENGKIPDLRSKIAEILLNDISSRLLSMYCDSPEERYMKLIDRYPDILTLVSLKEIASLIKITPETLSRIRRKLRALD